MSFAWVEGPDDLYAPMATKEAIDPNWAMTIAASLVVAWQ